MRWLLLLALLPSVALAQGPRIVSGAGTFQSGPRILGEPAFAFELDALTQDEASRPGWPVTTTRASTRMCWTGSEWQTVAANVPCIGRYGLASFGPGTNYAANSALLSGLQPRNGATIAAAPTGDGFRVTDSSTTAQQGADSVSAQSALAGESWTTTCEAKAVSGSTTLTMFHPGGNCTHTLTSEFGRYSCTKTVPSNSTIRAYCWLGATDAETGVFDLRQVQLEKAPTPGPRHDCGASACSWEGDVHTVPPAGWPVEAGEVRLQYTPLVSNPGVIRWLIDASIFNANGWELYVRDTNAIGFFSHRAGANSLYSSPALSWVGCDPTSTTCVPYDIRVAWGGGALRIWRDGVLVYENLSANMPEGPLTTPAVSIGARRTAPSSTPANGHIRLLRVSQ